jgi:carboxypeptidase C (cathepsin A)
MWIISCSNCLKDSADAPVSTWLQGGPGSSSLLGLFEINGPLSAVDGGPLGVTAVPNPYSWHNKAHMIYIDNPVGVGNEWKPFHFPIPFLLNCHVCKS